MRLRAAVAAQRFVVVGMDRATPAPGVLEAIRTADVVLLPPSNPVVSIGVILGVPGVRDALRGTPAPVVGVSPLVGGRPVRGHADACLRAIGVESSSAAVAGLYADFLDGWLVDSSDSDGSYADRVAVQRRPLLMSSPPAAAELAGAALDLALSLRGRGARAVRGTISASWSLPGSTGQGCSCCPVTSSSSRARSPRRRSGSSPRPRTALRSSRARRSASSPSVSRTAR